MKKNWLLLILLLCSIQVVYSTSFEYSSVGTNASGRYGLYTQNISYNVTTSFSPESDKDNVISSYITIYKNGSTLYDTIYSPYTGLVGNFFLNV